MGSGSSPDRERDRSQSSSRSCDGDREISTLPTHHAPLLDVFLAPSMDESSISGRSSPEDPGGSGSLFT
eukprot:5293203-Amphidinium_carterae.3